MRGDFYSYCGSWYYMVGCLVDGISGVGDGVREENSRVLGEGINA